MNPPPAFLTDFWRDVIAVSGLLGVVLTIVGLGIAYLQLRRTIGASQAAVVALNESRQQYARYAIAQLNRFFSDARLLITAEEWRHASVRLNDVAELLAQFPDDEFDRLEVRMREMAGQFLRIGAAEIQFRSIQSKWRKLEAEVGKCISRRHGPFPQREEAENVDEE